MLNYMSFEQNAKNYTNFDKEFPICKNFGDKTEKKEIIQILIHKII